MKKQGQDIREGWVEGAQMNAVCFCPSCLFIKKEEEEKKFEFLFLTFFLTCCFILKLHHGRLPVCPAGSDVLDGFIFYLFF